MKQATGVVLLIVAIGLYIVGETLFAVIAAVVGVVLALDLIAAFSSTDEDEDHENPEATDTHSTDSSFLHGDGDWSGDDGGGDGGD